MLAYNHLDWLVCLESLISPRETIIFVISKPQGLMNLTLRLKTSRSLPLIRNSAASE